MYLTDLIENARKQGYSKFVEPCAGTFAISEMAVKAGFTPDQISTSDVCMMSTILGYSTTGQSLEPLNIHAKGFDDEELLDPATALFAQMFLRTTKSAGNEYFYGLLEDMEYRKEEHIESIRKMLGEYQKILGGMEYRPLDMWVHLEECLDDEGCLIVLNPPTYFSGYEKFYDLGGLMTWTEPEYKLFDPETGYFDLFDMCADKPALVVCHLEKETGCEVGDAIYARNNTREGLNSYITTNHEDRAVELGGKKIKRKPEAKVEPLDCSILPSDYEITESSKVQILEISNAQSQYYRRLWTHNFVGSSATYNRALIIDGFIAGVFGISKMSREANFIWYVIKAPSNSYRLGRLIYQICRTHEFQNTIMGKLERETVKEVKTAMLTKYPENKEVRGIMKLTKRAKDKENGYKLTYEADLTSSTRQEVFQDWLKKEKARQKNV